MLDVNHLMLFDNLYMMNVNVLNLKIHHLIYQNQNLIHYLIDVLYEFYDHVHLLLLKVNLFYVYVFDEILEDDFHRVLLIYLNEIF
jgi:hypothetical protein